MTRILRKWYLNRTCVGPRGTWILARRGSSLMNYLKYLSASDVEPREPSPEISSQLSLRRGEYPGTLRLNQKEKRKIKKKKKNTSIVVEYP